MNTHQYINPSAEQFVCSSLALPSKRKDGLECKVGALPLAVKRVEIVDILSVRKGTVAWAYSANALSPTNFKLEGLRKVQTSQFQFNFSIIVDLGRINASSLKTYFKDLGVTVCAWRCTSMVVGNSSTENTQRDWWWVSMRFAGLYAFAMNSQERLGWGSMLKILYNAAKSPSHIALLRTHLSGADDQTAFLPVQSEIGKTTPNFLKNNFPKKLKTTSWSDETGASTSPPKTIASARSNASVKAWRA